MPKSTTGSSCQRDQLPHRAWYPQLSSLSDHESDCVHMVENHWGKLSDGLVEYYDTCELQMKHMINPITRQRVASLRQCSQCIARKTLIGPGRAWCEVWYDPGTQYRPWHCTLYLWEVCLGVHGTSQTTRICVYVVEVVLNQSESGMTEWGCCNQMCQVWVETSLEFEEEIPHHRLRWSESRYSSMCHEPGPRLQLPQSLKVPGGSSSVVECLSTSRKVLGSILGFSRQH